LLQRVSLVQSFRSPTNHSLCQKIRINVFYSIRIGTTAQVSFVLSQYTRLTDRLRDRRTDKNAFEIPCVRYIIYMQSQGKNAVQSDQTRPDRQKQNRQTWPDRSGPKSLPGLANEKKNIGIESTTAIVYSCCPFYVGNVNFAKIGVI